MHSSSMRTARSLTACLNVIGGVRGGSMVGGMCDRVGYTFAKFAGDNKYLNVPDTCINAQEYTSVNAQYKVVNNRAIKIP